MKVEKFEKSVYRAVSPHHFYGDLAGYFNADGQFIAHQTTTSGSFFTGGVWALEGFVLDEPVEIV